MIRRYIGFDAPSSAKFQLYVSHVRSILEYCSPLWSPANIKYILLLERVQRHATKYILNNYSDISYAERCIRPSILPLCFRREIIDLVLFYKYLHFFPIVSYFYRIVRLWNSLPRHIREASSVFSFKIHVNDLYFSILCNFNINERRTWSLVCSCGFCRP